MTEVISPIPSRIKNVSEGGHVCGIEDVFDDDLNKTQKQINTSILSPDAVTSFGSNDFVPLYDVNGKLVKISKSSFMSAMNYGIVEFIKNANKGSGTNKIAAVDNGPDIGFVGITDLGYLLGCKGNRTTIPAGQSIDLFGQGIVAISLADFGSHPLSIWNLGYYSGYKKISGPDTDIVGTGNEFDLQIFYNTSSYDWKLKNNKATDVSVGIIKLSSR